MKPKIIQSNELKEIGYGATKTTNILETRIFNIAKARKVSNDVK